MPLNLLKATWAVMLKSDYFRIEMNKRGRPIKKAKG